MDAPKLRAAAPGAVVAPGRYIVVLADGATSISTAPGLAKRYNAQLDHLYLTALNGFSARLTPADARRMANDPAVAFIEPDQVVSVTATQSPVPSWGVDRVDQRPLPMNGSYVYANTGAGVNVYIVDTGILTSHTDFGGRAVNGYDAIDGSLPAADCNGHGTHVAGTVGGAKYGVAKGAKLWAVRVLDCTGNGTYSQVIAGIDWVRTHRVLPAVANLSLGGPVSAALDSAVTKLIASGVTVAVAAGNSNTDACTNSPARVGAALTVGATTSSDYRATFSNYGKCVDLFAPGQSIVSDWYTSTTATTTLHGTSMSAPHVAGAAARYLESAPSASPSQVASALLGNATGTTVGNAGSGSPNKILYTGFISGSGTISTPPPSATPTTDKPPVASFTFSCTATYHECRFDSRASTDDYGIASRYWTWGDGMSLTSKGATPDHRYSRAGTYSVTLKVTDTKGQATSVTKSVTVP
ncbi:MAG TPA: S8 family serine peptidase [Gemmatimonadaceae bacterium]|nr:S8 family serine peptidase [Gemmatimonadaceae bacterium]